MSFPEKNKLHFKKRPPNLHMETVGNYLKIVCNFEMMNTGFTTVKCILEIQRKDISLSL